MTDEPTPSQIEARRRNWYVYRMRGMLAQVANLKHETYQHDMAAGTQMDLAVQKIEAAFDALNICRHKIDLEALKKEPPHFRCVKCRKDL